MYLERKIDSYLNDWFMLPDHKPLIVKGARQIGNGKAKFLNTLIASDKYEDITYGIKLTHGNIGFNNNVYTFPYFCTFLLKSWLKENK